MENVSWFPSFGKKFCFNDRADTKVDLFKFLPADGFHNHVRGSCESGSSIPMSRRIAAASKFGRDWLRSGSQ